MTITIFLISLLIITAATLGIYMSFFEPRHDGVPIKCIVKDAILYNLLFSFRVVMPVIVIFASILVVVCVFCDRGTLGSMLKPVFATIAWFSWCFWFSWRGCRAMNHDLKVGNLASIAIWKRWAVMLISWFFAVPLSILLAKLSFDNP